MSKSLGNYIGNKILELDEPDEFLNFRRLFKKVRYPPVLEYSPQNFKLIDNNQKNILYYFSSDVSDTFKVI